jgi:hypothetical protein
MSLYNRGRRVLGEREEPAPLNWRRGFFRLWILFSASWIMGWIIYLVAFAIREGMRSPGDLLAAPVLLLGPPVALFIFGVAAAWAFKGFSVEDQAAEK